MELSGIHDDVNKVLQILPFANEEVSAVVLNSAGSVQLGVHIAKHSVEPCYNISFPV